MPASELHSQNGEGMKQQQQVGGKGRERQGAQGWPGIPFTHETLSSAEK